MSTEARRASVPPRPDVPPQPGVPPRPATPPRPSRPPADPTDRDGAGPAPAEPPHRDPAGRATPGTEPREPAVPPRTPTDPPPRQAAVREGAREATPGPAEPQGGRRGPAGPTGAQAADRGEGTAGDGFPSSDTDSPFFRPASRSTGLRGRPTDAVPPPPPPASARFPDTAPQPAHPAQAPRRDDTGTPARAEERPAAPHVSRPAPPHDFRRAPRPPRPATRPGSADDSRPAGGAAFRAATPAPRPADGEPARPAGPEGSSATVTPGVRPAGDATTRPAAPESSPPTGTTGTIGSRPAGSDDLFSVGSGTRPAAPEGSRPVASPPSRPVVPPPPPPSRPVAPPPPSRPAGSTGAPSAAPASESAWSPLPRGWVPAPARSRRETEAESTGGGLRGDSLTVPAVADDGPAWSPGAAVRQPEFAVPPAPAAPPAPETARRTDGGPGTTGGPDPSLSWSAPMAPGATPGATRPVVTFARPEGYGDTPRTFGRRGRLAVAAACVVLGLGLIGGAVTGSWLVGDSADAAERSTYVTAGGLWHNVPVDQLFPPTVDGQGAGPGGADRTWTRIAVAPDSDCAGAFDPLLLKALAPVGCQRLLRATYTDATQSYVTTVGLLFTTADAAAMRSLDTRFTKEGLAERTDLMPRPYAAKGTVAAAFGAGQRAAWTVSVLTDAPVVVYAVSGWADGRVVDTPQPASAATAAGATTAPGQAGLGNEAQGLADRVERGLRKTAVTPSEQPS
ncbi:hypothetical protein ACWD3J_19720 [Streptomyces sp. NPDC002755]|uniref:hypothetical protein n=1 Tax=Streptomyces sp. NPDC002884 TaxID=3154544 RepID=UPI00331A067B